MELKLLIRPEDLTRALQLPMLRTSAVSEPDVHDLQTVYYDTPDFRLAAASVALRLRRDGDRVIQTVKSLNDDNPSDTAGVSVRREWDWTIPSEAPDLDLIEHSAAAGLIPEELRGQLAPIFSTRFTRTVFLVRPDPRTKIEVSVDDGEVVAGNRSERISEIELELVDGRMGRLFTLAQAMLNHLPIRIGTENKAEIGYRLVTGSKPRPVQPAPVALSPFSTVAEAFRHVVRHAMRQMLANEACALEGGEAEGLYQIRDAVRRLRTTARLFRAAIPSPELNEFRDELEWVDSSMRQARAWDVLCRDVLVGLEGTAQEPAGVAELRAVADANQRAPSTRAVETLSGIRFSRLLLGLGTWLEEGQWYSGADETTRALLNGPMKALSGPWLDELVSKIRKSTKTAESGIGPEMDKLRRRVRRLLHATEFFRGLYPPAAVRPFYAAVRALAGTLDRLHELDAAAGLVSGLSEKTSVADTVYAQLTRRCQDLRRQIPEDWRVFRETPEFWR